MEPNQPQKDIFNIDTSKSTMNIDAQKELFDHRMKTSYQYSMKILGRVFMIIIPLIFVLIVGILFMTRFFMKSTLDSTFEKVEKSTKNSIDQANKR